MTRPQRRRQNLWIDSPGGFVGAAWYWPTRIGASPTAVVIVPGIAHEEQRMNGGLVALAESLANAGLPALLIDLHGCSQGAGRLDVPDIGARWRADIRAAVGYARDSGAARVVVVGARLGFLLAADALSAEPLAALVAWAPVASGRRYVRELKVMQRAADVEAGAPGSIAIAGFSIPRAVTTHLATLDLASIELLDTPRILLCDTEAGIDPPWLAHMRAGGSMVEEQASDQVDQWLFGANDQADLPYDDILALTRWCRALHEQRAAAPTVPAPRRPPERRSIDFLHRGRPVRETFVEIGPNRMTGVRSEPLAAPSAEAVRLLMTTAGPGRMFVDFARDQASDGKSSLRFDFVGFGTSGRGDAVQGGEFYAEEGGRDVQAAIDYLRDGGHARIYAFGFCAGAWAMLKANVAPELRAVAAINVALFRDPGPASPRLAERTGRRLIQLSPSLARNPLLRKAIARVRRTNGKRHQPVDWLMRLCRADVRVMLAYAEHDPGLDYLRHQVTAGLHRQLRRPFVLRTYAGLDHLVGGPSARTRLLHDITEFFDGVDREAEHVRTPLEPPSPAVTSLRVRVLSN